MTEDEQRKSDRAAVEAGYMRPSDYVAKYKAADEHLQKLVFEALDNAVENGYPMIEWIDEAIADDLCDCNADFDTFEPEQLLPAIRLWKERQS